jgi:hypothetical protein
MQVTVPLEREKETKNTVRFKGDDDRLGMIYVPKQTVRQLGDPATLQVTLLAA